MIYKYRVADYGETETYIVESNLGEEDADWIAQDAAKDYHKNHDGWGSSWPLTFVILKEDETVIGKFSVDRDVEPVFRAYEYKETK